MSRMPEISDIIAVAKGFDLDLSPEEAAIYRAHLTAHLENIAAFVESGPQASPPPVFSPDRQRGHAPTDAEDPFNAWMWKCRIIGEPNGILAGKTVGFKDHIAVAGVPLTFGSMSMRDFVPDFDATVVTRVLTAGGTIVGKNSLDGLTGGGGFPGRAGDYPRPLNPHRPSHATGGSSSGSAAAVVAGEVDISFGGDQGGSIRIPAAWTGCIGLKPTFGLVSHFGAGFGQDLSIDFVGPMTRTHEDAAAALEAVAGFDELDPRAARDIPKRMEAISRLDEGIAGLRVGLLEEGFRDADPDVRDAVLAAADVLTDCGARVRKLSIPEHAQVRDAFGPLLREGARAVRATGFLGVYAQTYYPESLVAAMNRLWRTEARRLTPTTILMYLVGDFSRTMFDGRAYARAQNLRPIFRKAYDDSFSTIDVLVMPTCIRTAPKYRLSPRYTEELDVRLRDGVSPEQWYARNTLPFNYTGHPALALPCGKSDGLPISMQLVGRRLEDPLLIRVGYSFQHSLNWDGIVRVEEGNGAHEHVPSPPG